MSSIPSKKPPKPDPLARELRRWWDAGCPRLSVPALFGGRPVPVVGSCGYGTWRQQKETG